MHLRQVDMLQDGIAKSSATLSMMSKKLRRICVKSLGKHQKKKKQKVGGVNVLVHIDESKFCHKRKTYKREVWRMRGNRSEKTLKKQLFFIEWTYWLARTYKHGVLGRLIKDIRNANHR
ncbi:hypothetical protein F7725_026905 [Dissostichus mawsoni]|uniref:Uncharacterized protein n=1 Tax=Dissostichus mawsoni TaxID=36200 RepID=A0A7J5X8B3_DISMA|nr:hypothetical protein F7725_026905 [Dissostichus mawsoni]